MAILKTKRNNLEHNIQKSIVRWFKKNYPEYLIFAICNEACYRNSYFLESGVLSGVSDLICILPNKIIFVELKTNKGIQSKSQRNFESKIKSLNFDYHIIRSLSEFQELINSILVIN